MYKFVRVTSKHRFCRISLTDTDCLCCGYHTCETFCCGWRQLFDFCESHNQFQFRTG